MFELNNFDSEILGYSVGKLTLENTSSYKDFDIEAFNNFVATNHVKFIVCTATHSSQNINLLEQLGFKFISTKIVYKLHKSSDQTHELDNFGLQPLALSLSKGLIERQKKTELMLGLAATSHYSKNINLPKDTAKKIYTKWFKNTFEGKRAEEIFVARHQNDLAGFASLCKTNNQLSIDLIATHPEHRGKGIASFLVQQAIKYAKNFNKELYVVTQAENIAANRLYQKNGFIIESFQLIYHKII